MAEHSEQLERGLLARTTDYEEQSREDFSRFHLREGAVAGVYLTETLHPAAYRIPKHSHDVASLYFLVAGGLNEQFGGEYIDRKAGELIFTPADLPHSNVFHGCGARCLILELLPAIHSRLAQVKAWPCTLTSFRGHAAWLAKRLYNEFRSGDDASPLVIEGLILEIIAEICRQRPQLSSLGSKRKLNQAREFLDGALSHPVSLSDVAQAVDLHPVYLARRFRQSFGCSVGEYLRRRRVDLVCTQLLSSEKTLAEIASDTGFCDQAHLTRTFQKLIGTTPIQYRLAGHG
jgi:AraC family transcriptional regulator